MGCYWSKAISRRNASTITETAIGKAVPDALFIGAGIRRAIRVDDRIARVNVAWIDRRQLHCVRNQLQHYLIAGWYTATVGCDDAGTNFPQRQCPNLADVVYFPAPPMLKPNGSGAIPPERLLV